MAKDIINFFEVEDRNLNVRFLTLKCEKIPSRVHESVAMQEVYVLMHKSQEDYNEVIDRLADRDDTIIAQGLSMETLKEDLKTVREEMKKGFIAVSNLLQRKAGGNEHAVSTEEQVDSPTGNIYSVTAENERNETPNAVINSSDDDAPPPAPVEEREIADETILVGESIVMEEAIVSHREEEPESRRELEEGELSDTDNEDADYSMVSDTYNEVLDVGHNVSRRVSGFLSSVRQEQQQQSRASSLQDVRQQATLQRVQPATQMHRVGNERTNIPFLTKKTKKKCNLR